MINLPLVTESDKSVESIAFDRDTAFAVLNSTGKSLEAKGWMSSNDLDIWFPLNSSAHISAIALVKFTSIFRMEGNDFVESHRTLSACSSGKIKYGHTFFNHLSTKGYSNLALTNPDTGVLFPYKDGKFNAMSVLEKIEWKPGVENPLNWYLNLLPVNTGNDGKQDKLSEFRNEVVKGLKAAGAVDLVNYQITAIGFVSSFYLKGTSSSKLLNIYVPVMKLFFRQARVKNDFGAFTSVYSALRDEEVRKAYLSPEESKAVEEAIVKEDNKVFFKGEDGKKDYVNTYAKEELTKYLQKSRAWKRVKDHIKNLELNSFVDLCCFILEETQNDSAAGWLNEKREVSEYTLNALKRINPEEMIAIILDAIDTHEFSQKEQAEQTEQTEQAEQEDYEVNSFDV